MNFSKTLTRFKNGKVVEIPRLELPIEILQQIVKELEYDSISLNNFAIGKRKDLFNFSLVARSWRYPGTEALWETVEINSEGDLRILLILFNRVPLLATFVKVVAFMTRSDDFRRSIQLPVVVFEDFIPLLINLVAITISNVSFIYPKDRFQQKDRKISFSINTGLKTLIYTPHSEDKNLILLRSILDQTPNVDVLILNLRCLGDRNIVLKPLINCPILSRFSITHELYHKILDTEFPFIPITSLEKLKFFHFSDNLKCMAGKTDDWSKIIEIAGESIKSISIETNGFDYSLLKKLINLEKLFIETRVTLPINFLQLIPDSVQILGRGRTIESHLINLIQSPRPNLKINKFQFCDLTSSMYKLLPNSVQSISLPTIQEDDLESILKALEDGKAKGDLIHIREIVVLRVLPTTSYRTFEEEPRDERKDKLKIRLFRKRFLKIGIQLIGGDWYPSSN